MDDLKRTEGRYTDFFVLIYLLGICQEGVIKSGGTWSMPMVPDQRLGGQGHP